MIYEPIGATDSSGLMGMRWGIKNLVIPPGGMIQNTPLQVGTTNALSSVAA